MRSLGVAPRLRDVTTGLLAEIGIVYSPVGGDHGWLWCLGGPDVMRSPSADHVEQNMCVDLHLEVCEHHEIINIEIDGLDPIAVTGDGTGPGDPYRAEPIVLAETVDELFAAFAGRVRAWLPEVVVPQRT